ncbi:MAG TPA: hypothetical protein VE820_05005 [Sphingomicrobium sp.]|jgi:hypothetical protein|nr:hypothetical protein [Sphingomicrobium sp.]
MQLVRPAIAMDPRLFGKGRFWDLSVSPKTRAALSDDFKLFATTFVAGFLVVSILIG